MLLAREHPTAVVLLSKQYMAPAVEAYFRSEGLTNLAVGCPRDARGVPSGDIGILVGPVDEYPGHVFLAPRVARLEAVMHSWKRARPPLPRLPGSRGVPVSLAGRMHPVTRPTVASSIDLDALLRRLGREQLDDARSSAHEQVIARLVTLANDHFMFIESGGSIRVFEFSAAGEVKSGYVEVEALESGMFILERTGGATPDLEAVAEEMLGAEDEMRLLQDSQREWKSAIAGVINEIGIRELMKLLREAGCASIRADLVRSWVSGDTILPGDEECLRKLLVLAGKSNDEITRILQNGKAHRAMRIAAGLKISELLTDELRQTVDAASLHEKGTAEVSLGSGPAAPRMTMLRVELVDGELKVKRGQLRIVYDDLSDAENT
jgi:hypothetical protein